jgi:uncharacterized protein YqfA (UPF0365 family)
MLFAQNVAVLIFGVAIFIVLVVIVFRNCVLMWLWFQAKMTGLSLNLIDIVGMRFRRVNPRVVVQTLIMAKQAGIDLSCEEVERAYLQGADLKRITLALVRGKKEGTEMSFQELVEADLEGETRA